MPGAKKTEVDELDLQHEPNCTLYAPKPEDEQKTQEAEGLKAI